MLLLLTLCDSNHKKQAQRVFVRDRHTATGTQRLSKRQAHKVLVTRCVPVSLLVQSDTNTLCACLSWCAIIIYCAKILSSIWVFEYLSIWEFEYLSIWEFEYLSIWVFEYLSIWIFDSITHSNHKYEGSREQERKHAALARDRHTECYWYCWCCVIIYCAV